MSPKAGARQALKQPYSRFFSPREGFTHVFFYSGVALLTFLGGQNASLMHFGAAGGHNASLMHSGAALDRSLA